MNRSDYCKGGELSTEMTGAIFETLLMRMHTNPHSAASKFLVLV